MPIRDINHFFVRAKDLEATRAFYQEVLGFEIMPRPDFPFPGYWMGAGGSIQVHMGPSDIPNRSDYYLGTPPDSADDQSGVIDHIAFLAEDPAEFVARFKARGVSFKPRYLPEAKLYQLFLRDPNGVMIELNFANVADPGAWEGGEDYSKMARVS
ncbi:MAG: VOC family protein [Burkholderiaceae bacterium]|nr:VOC family protein [Burkholderiaceae bacterium]